MKNTAKIQDILIPVTIDRGMFSNEYSIALKLANGESVSFFADKTLVVEKANNWFLRASFIRKSGNNNLVLLPVEPFETQSRWAEVFSA